ncbi:MAG: SPASM domain-containing protein [Magnetococcales bacterium]|nr:SPASM domain-containing protein [Desulfobacterales bacterium]MBF0117111.1 SPASM domain-containing protein [Magnetococcales bacterium]
MFDIRFFKESASLKKSIITGQSPLNDDALINQLDNLRNPVPYVFNIETTNYCNMRCVMCPRTKLMTRKNAWIDDKTFERILDQIQPHNIDKLEEFWRFVESEYGINQQERSENGFYFHIVSRCLILHGYGEPLLDRYIVDRVAQCTKRNIPTYFSCVPANINMEKISALMENGLTVLKFSLDALSDDQAKAIRGDNNNFHEAFSKILQVIGHRDQQKFATLIVLTMISMSTDEQARRVERDFLAMWRDYDVYAYIKSQDNRWYTEEDPSLVNRSHYETQYCEYPWTSMTVMADGSVVPCTQDYNAEMQFGNARDQSCQEIWNSEAYRQFRAWHVNGQFPPGHKCKERCDQKKVYNYSVSTDTRG